MEYMYTEYYFVVNDQMNTSTQTRDDKRVWSIRHLSELVLVLCVL